MEHRTFCTDIHFLAGQLKLIVIYIELCKNTLENASIYSPLKLQ